MRISLIPLNGGERYDVTLPMILVGRQQDCDFRLDQEGVENLHCVLALSDDVLLIRDLNTDSIRVNGQRVRRAVLLDNDRLTIGSYIFRIQYQD